MKRLILELSLKAFQNPSPEATESVIREILQQWQPLIRKADSFSFLLWTADGSEILEYRGQMEDPIEWACWIGIANEAPPHPQDPAGISLHSKGHLYCENPPGLTYGRLRDIVGALKRIGRMVTGKPVTVGATFDPGPEFARSEFKYLRHPEINHGHTMGHKQWLHCAAILHGEERAYAGFPQGIPEGTSIGVFLGRQSRHFLTGLDFDYLWLSNGFGFSLDSWNVTGEVFDGERYDTSNAEAVRSRILRFWHDFRKENPDFPIETRGSNLSTGMDLSSDASPVRDIYRGGFNLTAPVNSPWAALNGDYGLELVGWLSHIAELPDGGGVAFRYYLHDPWWLNSPWFDRYGREPHDIYLPLATSRLDSEGQVTRPESVAFLTIDNSFGHMPEEVAMEVIPHIRRALEDFPDEPGLVTWIYPFDEYHEWTFGTPNRADEVFFGDWFLRSAVNQGFPLSTVISSGNYVEAAHKDGTLFAKSILLSPAPAAGSALADQLLAHLESGGSILLYGPLGNADERLLQALELRIGSQISGGLEIRTSLSSDQLVEGSFPTRLQHRTLTCGGGIDTLLESPDASAVEVLATVENDQGESRIFAAYRRFGQGRIGWLRGALAETVSRQDMLPVRDDPSVSFPSERLLRGMLERFGYVLRFAKPSLQTPDPLIIAARCRNGWYFSGYSPSTSVLLKWRFPEGVPIPVGCDVSIRDGEGTMSLARAWHRECRIFVVQDFGEVSCREQFSGEAGIRRRLLIQGLRDAVITFLPDSSMDISSLTVRRHQGYLGQGPQVPFHLRDSTCLITENFTGELLISW